MANIKLYLLGFILFSFACQTDYIDSHLTSGDWELVSVEERRGFKWEEVTEQYDINSIRFFSNSDLSLTYWNDTMVYAGDWTDFYEEATTVDGEATSVHLLVVNAYHDSPLPTVFTVSKLRSNRLVLNSEEKGGELCFEFRR